MMFVIAYLLVAVGNFIGLCSSEEHSSTTWNIVMGLLWPVTLFVTMLLILGIIRVKE